MRNQVYEAIEKKFPAKEYAVLEEVRDAAGFNSSRSADFVIKGLWPSRGLDLIGVERKSYRGDWLKELKTPEKAENIYQYCDRWYLLTDRESVAKIEEIPESWGWMHLNEKGRLITVKEAPKLNPVPVSKTFLATILKRAACRDGWIKASSIDERIEQARELGRNDRDYKNQRVVTEYNELLKTVKEFEEACGIKLTNTRWMTTGKKLGEIVSFIDNGGVDQMHKQIENIKNWHSVVGKSITQFDNIFTGNNVAGSTIGG